MFQIKVTEFFESQNSHESLGSIELFHLLKKSKLHEKNLSQDNDKLRIKVNRLESIIRELKQGNFDISLETVLEQERKVHQAEIFGKSSERSTQEEIAANVSANDDLIIPGANDPGEADGGVKAKRSRLPSVRYPNRLLKNSPTARFSGACGTITGYFRRHARTNEPADADVQLHSDRFVGGGEASAQGYFGVGRPDDDRAFTGI